MAALPWKRVAVALAVGVLAVGSLVGCGGGTPAQDDDTLTVWFPGNDPSEMKLVKDTLVPRFEKETGAKVEVTYVDWADISPKLNAAFAAGTAPDVFGHGVAAAADFVANDRLVDLTPYVHGMSAADRDDLAAALPGGQVGGKQYAMPLLTTLRLMVYSGADFTAAGLDPKRPPTTWEQARTDARTLTTRTGGRIVRSGMAVPSQPIARQQSYATLLWSAGGDFLSKDGKSATLDTPAASTALDFYTSLYQGGQAVDGTLGAAWSDQPPAQQPIVTGKASMELVSVESIADLRAAAPKRDIRIMPPLSLAGGEPAVFGGAANGLMINKDSRHKDLGWKFIEYMTSKDISNQYATNLGSLPIRTSASESPAVRKDPVLSQAVGYLKYARGNPNVPGWVQMRDKLDQSLERSLRGTQSPADALRQASSDLDGLLAANG